MSFSFKIPGIMFPTVFDRYEWSKVKESIYDKKPADVERALARDARDLEDFKALISPAAAPYLEEMAQISHPGASRVAYSANSRHNM